MTADEISLALMDELQVQKTALNVSGGDTLTVNQNVHITDALAAKLETVNPTTNYPPTAR